MCKNKLLAALCLCVTMPVLTASAIDGPAIKNDIVSDTPVTGAYSDYVNVGNGGVILNNSTLTVDGGSYANNQAKQGGAIYNAANLTIQNGTTFMENQTSGSGGAVFSHGALNISEATFEGNSSQYTGGALSTGTATSGLTTIENSIFKNNTVKYDGGAISHYSQAGLTIKDTQFIGNKANVSGSDGVYVQANEDSTALGGGAIAFGSISNAAINTIEGALFEGNVSGSYGGAIATRHAQNSSTALNDNSGAKLDINATFRDNTAVMHGGAIYNSFYKNTDDSADGVRVSGIFENNTAYLNGGAIFNDGTPDKTGHGGVMTILEGSSFVGNQANQGGAIMNYGDGASVTIMDGVVFSGNSANSVGGAISTVDTGSGKTVIGDNVSFIGNKSGTQGGAVHNQRATTEIGNNVKFQDNVAVGYGGGAIYQDTDSAASSVIIGKAAEFVNNRTETSHGGAIMNFNAGNGATLTVGTGSKFESNSAYKTGGAISNWGGIASVADGAIFNKNTANTNGGAIYHSYYGTENSSFTVGSATFTENVANGNGGAIYNDGTMSVNGASFSGNTATEGGAIYNVGTLTLNGANSFETSSDTVYNEGSLTIASGETTVNASLSGTGANTVNNGATLDISADNMQSAVTNNGSLNLGAGTLSQTISGTGTTYVGDAVSINAAQYIGSANINLANNSTLKFTENATIGAITAGNGVTVDMQGAAQNLTLSSLDGSLDLKIDWKDTFNATSVTDDSSVVIKSIDMATANLNESYVFTSTLGDKVAFATDSEYLNMIAGNAVTYSAADGKLAYEEVVNLQNLATTDGGAPAVVSATYAMGEPETFTTPDATIELGDGSVLTVQGSTEQQSGINGGIRFDEATVKIVDTNIDSVKDSQIQLMSESGNSSLTFVSENKQVNINSDIISKHENNNVHFGGRHNIHFYGLFDPATATVELNNAELVRGGADEGIQWVVNSGTLRYLNDNYLHQTEAAKLNSINLAGGSLDLINGVATDINLDKFEVTAPGSNLYLDMDVNNAKIDNFVADTYNVTEDITIKGLNVLGVPSKQSVIFDLADAEIKDHIILSEEAEQTLTTPIYKYGISYDRNTGKMSVSAVDGWNGVNSAVMVAPVAAQLGGYLTQLNTNYQAFGTMDMMMLMTKEQRQALKMANKYASADAYSYTAPISTVYDDKALWYRPFSTFESVGLKGGTDVSNVSYGSFFGGDSEIMELGHGWDGMFGVFAGYNGSHQAFQGNSIYQNGGALGVVGMAYKGDFFTGLTLNTGANAGQAHTMFGSEDFSMLMAGIASKTGYNWELANGRFIIQPSYLMSYSFVNTFDYNNAAGVRIDSDPLHAIQIEPGLKFIGNLDNGWQPYLGVSMVWNVMDKTTFKANAASLPELSVKPFVRYGLGVRKIWGDRCTGFLQAFLTGGGRQGIGLQGGFRWTLGKDRSTKFNAKNTLPEKEQTNISISSAK